MTAEYYDKRIKQFATLPCGRVVKLTSARKYRYVSCCRATASATNWGVLQWHMTGRAAERAKTRYSNWRTQDGHPFYHEVRIVPVDNAPAEPTPAPSLTSEPTWTPPPPEQRWTNCIKVGRYNENKPTRFFYRGFVLQEHYGGGDRVEWYRPGGEFVIDFALGSYNMAQLALELRRAVDAIIDGTFADLYPRQGSHRTAPQQHDQVVPGPRPAFPRELGVLFSIIDRTCPVPYTEVDHKASCGGDAVYWAKEHGWATMHYLGSSTNPGTLLLQPVHFSNYEVRPTEKAIRKHLDWKCWDTTWWSSLSDDEKDEWR